MNKILKEVKDNIARIYLQMFLEELDALSKELGISSLELITNLAAQDYITMKELKRIDKFLEKKLKY